ncbi:transglycosylase SLT domain-containing protein [Methylopila henanensis]|uniref:Transglycosylase SLT domain-containing protein n=1 Tax=Methylopila henanensis TaxID=873516 RepID=A0ABW4K1N6_9HYPH
MSAFRALLRGVAASSLLAAQAAYAEDGGETVAAPEQSFVVAYDATNVTGAIAPASRVAPSPTVQSADVAQVKAAVAAFQRGDLGGAMAVRASLRDPGAVALVDWLSIRFASRQVGFDRINSFLRAHRDWPTMSMVRRRAEEALWLENVNGATVRAFFAQNGKPKRAEGKLALARALLDAGQKDAAATVAREAWRTEDLAGNLEAQALSRFGPLLTTADHRARAERQFLNDNVDAGLRAAARVGGSYVAVGKAIAAVIRRRPDAPAALAAVPTGARSDPAFIFASARHARRADRPKEAAAMLARAPLSATALADPDAWSVERRVIARDLLDLGDARGAYELIRRTEARSDTDRIESEMLAGFIALRALGDGRAAYRHFTVVQSQATIPGTLSRALYWQGRALEALGDQAAARASYERASRHITSYYGQIARARLKLADLPVRRLPEPTSADRATFNSRLSVRAIDLLYRVGDKELALPMVAGLAEDLRSGGELTLLGELTQRNKDPRATLVVGRAGINSGFPMDVLAYPTGGIPAFKPVGPAIETPVVHAIARQESSFNPRAVSHANARGLLQLLPTTAARTAKAAGVPFNAERLTTDAAFNAQLGAAHLGELARDFRGSYVMVFAAYNAGSSRVIEWVRRYGDPRKPDTDPVDWVERIPFTETRNYVQRVLENTQVYRTRLNGRTALLIERDMARGGE